MADEEVVQTEEEVEQFAATVTKKRAYHGTLSGTSTDVVTILSAGQAIRVYNRSTNQDVFYTMDGSAPTANGDDCYLVPAGQYDSRINTQGGKNSCTIKLMSSGGGSAVYSVEAIGIHELSH